MKTTGTLVISLDFELMWGMFDKVSLNTYGKNIRGVHAAIPRTLELFQQYDIHASWATVGMLMYPNKATLVSALPPTKPTYLDKTLSAYEHLEHADIAETDTHYFAPDLVKQIIATPHQELASHTFSHYYALEEQTAGGEREAFATDCTAIETVASQFGTTLSSVVFPRNQYSEETLGILRERGYTAFRGTEANFIYAARNESAKTNLFLRGLRFLDRYCNLTGMHTYQFRRTDDSLQNIPASRQLIPYSAKLRFLEWLRLRRIKNAMTHAAKRGEVFHLWWHPHNFGINQDKNFELLENLLSHYKKLQATYEMRSLNMQELAAIPSDESIV